MFAFVDGIVGFLQRRSSVMGCPRRISSRDQILGVSPERGCTFLSAKSEMQVQSLPTGEKRLCRDRTNDSTDDSDFSVLSTDGSDKETTSSQAPSSEPQPADLPSSSTSARSLKAPQHKAPPGFTVPPGLPAPRMNARPERTTQTLRQLQGKAPVTMDDIRREMLSDVMSKLNSEDADILKMIFNATPAAAASTASTRLAGTGFHDPRQQRSRMLPSRETRCHQALLSTSDGNSLRANLRRLATTDEKRIVFVKKIATLGVNSSRLLEKHFSRFGSVEEVLCTHAIDKRAELGKPPRARPANAGFVVFAKVEDAAAAVRSGSEQVVVGMRISVGTYAHQLPKDACGNTGGEQQLCESTRS